jgi:hypothetical protein
VFPRLVSTFASERRGLVGCALLRVGFSAIELTNYLYHYSLRRALWGPAGLLDWPEYVHTGHVGWLDLYAFSSTESFSAAVFVISVVVALLYGLGVLPGVTCWLFAVTTYANVHRNPLATDAGENMIVLLSWLLCFTDSSAYFCLFRIRPRKPLWGSFTSVVNMLHNAARFLIAWQICMTYFWAAFWKLGGDDWRNGTVMYTILHIQRFEPFPALSNALAANSVIVALLTYSTLAVQMSFPFLMWNQRVKPYIVFLGVAIHAGIAFVMGLVSFSLTMIFADLSLLSDQQIHRLLASTKFCRGSVR